MLIARKKEKVKVSKEIESYFNDITDITEILKKEQGGLFNKKA